MPVCFTTEQYKKILSESIKFLNENCSYRDGDRYLSPEIKKVSDSILSGYILNIVLKNLTLE